VCRPGPAGIQRFEPALEFLLEPVHRFSQQRAADLQLGAPICLHGVREPGGNPLHLPGRQSCRHRQEAQKGRANTAPDVLTNCDRLARPCRRATLSPTDGTDAANVLAALKRNATEVTVRINSGSVFPRRPAMRPVTATMAVAGDTLSVLPGRGGSRRAPSSPMTAWRRFDGTFGNAPKRGARAQGNRRKAVIMTGAAAITVVCPDFP
jgi:hypothetical protein